MDYEIEQDEVICNCFIILSKVINHMNAENSCFSIGICGGSGSGKTTLARMLAQKLGPSRASILSQDSYYRDLSQLEMQKRKSVNFDHPDALEWEMLQTHLSELKLNKDVSVPVYDFLSHTRIGSMKLNPSKYVIIEGHLLFHNRNIRRMIDLKIFLHNDIDILLLRRIVRDTSERGRSLDDVIFQYMSSVRSAYFNYVDPCRRWADMTLVFDKNQDCCIDEIVKKIY